MTLRIIRDLAPRRGDGIWSIFGGWFHQFASKLCSTK